MPNWNYYVLRNMIDVVFGLKHDALDTCTKKRSIRKNTTYIHFSITNIKYFFLFIRNNGYGDLL